MLTNCINKNVQTLLVGFSFNREVNKSSISFSPLSVENTLICIRAEEKN